MSTQSYYLTEFESAANKKVDTIPLCVNCAGIVDRDTFSTSATRRDFYFMYITEGVIDTCLGTMQPGDIVIFPAGFTYNYTSSKKATYLWVHFSGSCCEEYIKNISLPIKQIVHIGLHETLKSHFETLFYEFMLNDAQSEEMSVCILKEILILSSRYQKDLITFAPLKSISYINRNYTKNICIEDLAELEQMSLTAYRIFFKKHTGTSPLQYINSRRLSAACRLLEGGNIPVALVSSKLGFTDPYYFSRFFKKHMGLSPKQFQKSKMV